MHAPSSQIAAQVLLEALTLFTASSLDLMTFFLSDLSRLPKISNFFFEPFSSNGLSLGACCCAWTALGTTFLRFIAAAAAAGVESCCATALRRCRRGRSEVSVFVVLAVLCGVLGCVCDGQLGVLLC